MGQGKGEQKNSPRRITSRERALEMLALKKAGLTYDAIATRMGCVKSLVHKKVTQLLRELPVEGVMEVRALELSRLDDALVVATRIMRNAADDVSRLCAVDRLIRIATRRADLLGLDAPKRIITTEMAIEEMIDVVRSICPPYIATRIFEELARRGCATGLGGGPEESGASQRLQ